MFTRRLFLKSTILFGSQIMALRHAAAKAANTGWYLPEESHTHKCTWMAFIASDRIWAQKQIPEVQQNLANIAKTIAKYEPVKMLVNKEDRALAIALLDGLDSHSHPISLYETALNDLWIRDTGPTFVINQHLEKAAVDFNFNGWGEDQDYALDAKVAGFIQAQAHATAMRSTLTLEGGCFEVDGQGTAILSESCILNDNRNPNTSKAVVETELKALLGLSKIIWLKGIKGRDITDGHTDFYARFAKPGVVVVSRDTYKSSFDYAITRENINILTNATDAHGKPLDLVILDTPWDINSQFGTKDFAAGYVGYYVCNGAIIMQKFGDKQADQTAREQLAKVFPHHQIVQISIDGIASGGGSIHCATQQEPAV